MNPLLRSAIRELRDSHGITLDPLEDLEHIMTLAKLADGVMRVQRDLTTEAILRPTIRAGGTNLYRLSIGAADFLREQVCEWFSEDSRFYILSFGFCHAHVIQPAEIWAYRSDRTGWKKRLTEWAKTLDCSWTELGHAIGEFQTEAETLDKLLIELKLERPVPEDRKKEDNAGSGNMGPLVEILSHEYPAIVPEGMTQAEFWIWRVPMEEIELLTNAYLDRKHREARAQKTGRRGAPVTDPDQMYVRSHYAMRHYLLRIVDEKKGDAKCQAETES